jgi:hypothetical protein
MVRHAVSTAPSDLRQRAEAHLQDKGTAGHPGRSPT